MARDGTRRGHGSSGPKAGRPSKALKEKIEQGNPGRRKLQVIEFDGKSNIDGPLTSDPVGELPEVPPVKVESVPAPREYMEEKQNSSNGGEFYAKQIFEETIAWLDRTGCRELVEREVIDLYAVSAARWIQCERAISEYSFLSPHPTTKLPMKSPYADLSNQYSKTMMNCWYTIYQIVKENSLSDYKTNSPQESVMDLLLSE